MEQKTRAKIEPYTQKPTPNLQYLVGPKTFALATPRILSHERLGEREIKNGRGGEIRTPARNRAISQEIRDLLRKPTVLPIVSMWLRCEKRKRAEGSLAGIGRKIFLSANVTDRLCCTPE